jgi:hypothetical protein
MAIHRRFGASTQGINFRTVPALAIDAFDKLAAA